MSSLVRQVLMELQSARDLKSLLIQTVLAPILAEPRSAALDLAAGPIDGIEVRSFALGIAPHRKNQFRLAVRCQRPELMASRQVEQIRNKAKDEVDVRYIGRVNKLAATPWPQKQHRPLQIGSSIGHSDVTAGTLGCVVRSQLNGASLLLSNNHVFANENKGKKGDPILQPGSYDGGKLSVDVIGKLFDFVRLKKTGKNYVDCAVASLGEGIEVDSQTIKDIGKLAGLGNAFLDEGANVSKYGRTTKLTRGRVTAFELDNVVVRFGLGNLRFDDQIEIEGIGNAAFSRGGDSGSLVVDDQLHGVGLLFAGADKGGTNGEGLAYSNPLRAVLDALKVDLVA